MCCCEWETVLWVLRFDGGNSVLGVACFYRGTCYRCCGLVWKTVFYAVCDLMGQHVC